MADDDAHDFSTVPDDFVTDGKPDFPAYRAAYDTALGGTGGGGLDVASIPERFVADGKADLGAYKVAFEDAIAFKAQDDERRSALPKDAAGYAFSVPEDIKLPEGFAPPEDFKLELKPDDPRVPAIKALALEHGLDQVVVDGIARLWAEHEVAEIHRAAIAHGEETKKLGPDGEARMSALERVVGSRVPKAQADALLADLTSSDALRAVEALVASNRGKAPATPGGNLDMREMTVDQRLNLATKLRAEGRKRA